MTATLYAVTFDCADPPRVAQFWSDVLGRPVDEGATDEFASIGIMGPGTGEPGWMFVAVPEHKQVKNRFHPDLIAPDLEAEKRRLVVLGAVEHDAHTDEEFDARWVTLTDPEGNEFDLIAAPQTPQA